LNGLKLNGPQNEYKKKFIVVKLLKDTILYNRVYMKVTVM